MSETETETPAPPTRDQARPQADFVPPYILRNRGVPIVLYRLQDGKLPDPPDDLDDEDDWEPPTRKVHLRFNANHVAEIEEAFDGLRATVPVVEKTVVRAGDGTPLEGPAGLVYEEKVVGHEERVFYGTEAFQKAMEIRTNATVRRIIAIALETDEHEIGEAMIPSRFLDYNNAVGVAWSMAQGVDPSEAAKVLQRATAAVAGQREALASELNKTMDEGEGSTTGSPGATG